MSHNRGIGSLNPQAQHLLSLLENPVVSLDRIASAISVGVDRNAPPEFVPLEMIDSLAAEAGGTVDGPVEALEHVFGALGFVPNASDYYSLSNSLLHRVLEDRRGNPISLGVVAIEISKRLGVRLVPVGMPAHFLIGHASGTGEPDRWFDPFAGGRELTSVDAQQIFDSLTPASSEFSVLMLGETPLPFVAGRIVANIKNAAIRAGDISAFVAACEMALGLPMAGPNEHKALVRALTSSGRHDRAAEVFEWLAENDAANADEHQLNLKRQLAHRN